MTPAHELIKFARHHAGLSQVSLASRMGVPQSVIARLERPGSNPTWATLSAALEATGCSLELRRRRATPPVPLDLGQLRESLALTPAERLRTFEESQRNLDRLVAVARRVPDG
jgi:transcriptional regulator with XRE-family HTH domain